MLARATLSTFEKKSDQTMPAHFIYIVSKKIATADNKQAKHSIMQIFEPLEQKPQRTNSQRYHDTTNYASA